MAGIEESKDDSLNETELLDGQDDGKLDDDLDAEVRNTGKSVELAYQDLYSQIDINDKNLKERVISIIESHKHEEVFLSFLERLSKDYGDKIKFEEIKAFFWGIHMHDKSISENVDFFNFVQNPQLDGIINLLQGNTMMLFGGIDTLRDGELQYKSVSNDQKNNKRYDWFTDNSFCTYFYAPVMDNPDNYDVSRIELKAPFLEAITSASNILFEIKEKLSMDKTYLTTGSELEINDVSSKNVSSSLEKSNRFISSLCGAIISDLKISENGGEVSKISFNLYKPKKTDEQ